MFNNVIQHAITRSYGPNEIEEPNVKLLVWSPVDLDHVCTYKSYNILYYAPAEALLKKAVVHHRVHILYDCVHCTIVL